MSKKVPVAHSDNDWWARAVHVLTGVALPARADLFDSLIGNNDIPLMRLEFSDYDGEPSNAIVEAVDNMSWRTENSGWRINNTDFVIPFYSGKHGPISAASPGTKVVMKQARITLLGTSGADDPPAGGVVVGSEFSSKLGKDFEGQSKDTVWSNVGLSHYSYGGGMALQWLLNNNKTTGFEWYGLRVNEKDAVDLDSFYRSADALDRAARFFKNRYDDLRDWEFDLGKEDASWKGMAAGVFRDMIHGMTRNYKSYSEQIPVEGTGSKYGNELRKYRQDIYNASNGLYTKWNSWQLAMGNPLRWLHDILLDVSEWIWDNNITKVRYYEDYGYEYYDSYHAVKLDGFHGDHPTYGQLEDKATWKKIGEEAIKKWQQSVVDTLGTAGKEAVLAIQNSVNDQDLPKKIDTETTSLSQEFAKDQAAQEKAKAEEEKRKLEEENKKKEEEWERKQKEWEEKQAEAERKAEEKEKEWEKKQEEAERKAEEKEKEQERKQEEKEKEQEAKQAEQERKQEEKEREAEAKQAEQEAKQEEKEKEQEAKQAEQERKQEEKEREAEAKQAEQEAKQEQKQAEQEQKQEERYKEQEAQQLAATTLARAEREQEKKEQEKKQAEQEAKQEEKEREQEAKQAEQERKAEEKQAEQERKQEEKEKEAEAKQAEQEQKRIQTESEYEDKQAEQEAKQEQKEKEQEQKQAEQERKAEAKQAEQEAKQEQKEQEQEAKQAEQEQKQEQKQQEAEAKQAEQERKQEERQAEAEKRYESQTRELGGGNVRRYESPDLPSDYGDQSPSLDRSGGTTTLNPDRTVTLEYPDGSSRTIDVPGGDVSTVLPDGSTDVDSLRPGDSITNSDGSITTLERDGTLTTEFPDGSSTRIDPEKGLITNHQPDGTTTTTPIESGETLPSNLGGSTNLHSPSSSSSYDGLYGSGNEEELYDTTPYNGDPSGNGYGSGGSGSPGGMPMLPPGTRMNGSISGGAGSGDTERVRGVFDDAGQPIVRRVGTPRPSGSTQDEEEIVAARRGGMSTAGGMPFAPPMGGGMGGGQPQTQSSDRERAGWVEEDEDVWGTDEGGAPAVIGR
ncbi:AAWKG family protein [Streptomyces sp. LZ34]